MSDARSIWSRPARGSRGPVPAHSREAIARAGVALADAEGLAAVSMRAVAAALGTAAGSLYRYLSSRDDLLDLMVDAAVAELRPYPADGAGGLDGMLLLARRQLALYRSHPWLAAAAGRGATPGPNTLAYLDACLRILQPLDCGVAAKFEAIAMTTGVVSLFARNTTPPGGLTFDGLDLAPYPHLAAAFAEPGVAPPGDLFERTLLSLLTGLVGTTGPGRARTTT